MATFEPQTIIVRLEKILALIKSNDSVGALSHIADLVAELRLLDEEPVRGHSSESREESARTGRGPEPWRAIAAQLKAAEVQIQATHLSHAQESLEKAIYVAEKGGTQAAGAQLNV
jgi:hypothetical protein